MKKIAEQLAMLEKLQTFVLGYSLLIGAQGTRLLRDIEVTGDPAGAIARALKKSFVLRQLKVDFINPSTAFYFIIKVTRL
ncbi:hypothetical protein BTR25_26680 [Bacillus sp. MRMR6]|nr:hypothetical protein BTR25_26680 [Bacillus sp. MRMR6]